MALHLIVGMILGSTIATIMMAMLFTAKRAEETADEINGNGSMSLTHQELAEGRH
jgi:hypothetical protein